MVRYKRVILAAAITLLLILLVCIPFRESVVIEDGQNGKLLAYFPLEEDKTFHIQYTHSIHLSNVKETYQVLAGGTIRQIELMYEDTSIGMPSNAEEGETFEIIDGTYHIRNMKRDFPLIALRVGQVAANHKLIVYDKTVPFTSFVQPGSFVKVKEKRLALWQLWKGVNIVG